MDNAQKKGLEWPNSAQQGDPIRGMIVCGEGQFTQPKHVWETINGPGGFKVERCKANFAVSNRPPDMYARALVCVRTEHLC